MLMEVNLQKERGATIVVVAASLVMLLGFAAIAIDVGAGFNERRQDQTAGDTGVMAGALGIALLESPQAAVTQVLAIARQNLDSTYSDPQWQTLWESCADPGRINFEIGNGSTQTFTPMPKPAAWGAGTLDCVSSGSSYVRVRIPNQSVATSFARIWGMDELEASAAAVAIIEPVGGNAGLLPFGIAGGTPNGEVCLKSSGSGIAEPPCQGPTAGTFGEINSEFFGDFFGSPSCANPGHTELAQNIALGIDHFLTVWPAADGAAEGVTLGSPHPGDTVVAGYQGVNHDDCSLSGSSVSPSYAGEAFPPNTLRVRTGFDVGPVESGLMSDDTFFEQPSRLQDTTLTTRSWVRRRTGANDDVWPLENVGPWTYLTGNGSCDASTYTALVTTDEKVERFHDCLTDYSGTADIFSANIEQSQRFAWAPEYWHDTATTGVSWQPVHRYRMVFLGGLWANSSTPGAQYFYPDQDVTSEICAPAGGTNCALLALDQLSAWLLPDEAVPASVRNSFPGGQSPFEPSLYR